MPGPSHYSAQIPCSVPAWERKIPGLDIQVPSNVDASRLRTPAVFLAIANQEVSIPQHPGRKVMRES